VSRFPDPLIAFGSLTWVPTLRLRPSVLDYCHVMVVMVPLEAEEQRHEGCWLRDA